MVAVTRFGLSLFTVKLTFGKTGTLGSLKCDERLIAVAGASCATVTLSSGAVRVAESSTRGSRPSEIARVFIARRTRAGRAPRAARELKAFGVLGTSGGGCGG